MSFCGIVSSVCVVFFCKQKTAYEMRISDWSSDVCSSDLARFAIARDEHEAAAIELLAEGAAEFVIGQITAARNTVAALEQQPVIVAPHDHVDHARNRVRAVDRRGAVLEHFHALHRLERERIEIDGAARRVGEQDRKSTRLNSSH